MRVEGYGRKRLEQLCRYVTRPTLSVQRIQFNLAGQAELKLKTPSRDGTTHLVMSPLGLMHAAAGGAGASAALAPDWTTRLRTVVSDS